MQDLIKWLGKGTARNVYEIDRILLQRGQESLELRILGDSEMYRDAKIRDATMFFFQNMPGVPDQRNLRIDAYFVPLIEVEKEIPSSNVIDKIHVNSGMCVKGGKPTKIYVFRNEEIRKVFFHEMLHACGVLQKDSDFPLNLTQDAVWKGLLSSHPWLKTCQDTLRLNEATTEALACALEVKFRNLYAPRKGRSFSDAMHSKKVCQMFLEWGDFWGSESKCDTNAIEYYVLKHLIYQWALDSIT